MKNNYFKVFQKADRKLQYLLQLEEAPEGVWIVVKAGVERCKYYKLWAKLLYIISV